jgi:hypothetical protein
MNQVRTQAISALHVFYTQAMRPPLRKNGYDCRGRIAKRDRLTASQRADNRFRQERPFAFQSANDLFWVESCRFRLADRAAVVCPVQAFHSASGESLTCCVPFNRQNSIPAFQPNLPEAPFWANV